MKSILLALLLTSPACLADIQVYFSPEGGCTDAITNTIGKARSSLLVQAYSFTSAPIAKALVDAKKRGVVVSVILDDSNLTDKYSSATFLKNAGVPTWIDSSGYLTSRI